VSWISTKSRYYQLCTYTRCHYRDVIIVSLSLQANSRQPSEPSPKSDGIPDALYSPLLCFSLRLHSLLPRTDRTISFMGTHGQHKVRSYNGVLGL